MTETAVTCAGSELSGINGMAHGLAIVVGENWESQMQRHCVYGEHGSERDGEFDSCEIGGRFGKPFKLRRPQARRGLFRLFGTRTHTTQARRSEIELDALTQHFGFAVVADGEWHEPNSFDEARQLLNAIPGDPLLTAIDYHL